MHKDDLAEVLGKEPVVLLFATPQFCQSRVCGPVVDEAEQVNQTDGKGVSFIHMEIYKDNNPSLGARPQVKAFRLESEPWLFVIDKRGIIRTRIEGAWSVPELERAVRAVQRSGAAAVPGGEIKDAGYIQPEPILGQGPARAAL